MTNRHSCSTCAFMRHGKIRDRYSYKMGWITHDGVLCRLYPPYKGTQSPTEPDGICSRWTDAETLEQPLVNLCPSFVAPATQTPDAPEDDVRSEVDA